MELMAAGRGGGDGGGREEMVGINQQGRILPWLPAYVLDEALALNSSSPPPITTDHYRNHKEKKELDLRGKHYCQHHHHYHPLKFNAQPYLQNRTKYYYKPRYHNNRAASGGPGMQAIFLDSSGQKSNGTGVFLPRSSGDTNFHKKNKPPACSPVLLPSKVVQALNLNVQALGLQIAPKQVYNSANNKKMTTGESIILEGADVNNHVSITSRDQCSSHEIFLPKEWTY